jgi:photosystem I P700 chlorophyll a apoprotein A2
MPFQSTYFSAAGAVPAARALAPHLSWIGLFLGFHALGPYVHSDAVLAFGDAGKALLIQPVAVQSLQAADLCPADFLVQHAAALGIHTSLLVLLQGGSFPASRLDPDKRQRGFGFACDGPGRGGTCDISGWDSVYLAPFWVLNTLGWLSFYEHWRSVASLDAFCSTGSTLCGWFRDYLWLNSGNLVSGFSPAGSSELAVLAWSFLLAHLVWATSFMFLISWRGYWQELVESLLFIHLKTPIVATAWAAGFTPVALSILQARFVGLAHFTVGFIGTFAAFLLST